MYHTQKGLLPILAGLLSYVLPISVLLLLLDYVMKNIYTRIPDLIGNSTKPIWLVVAMLFITMMVFPVFFGMMLASIFPSVEIRRDGLSFKYWEFFGCKVKWNEIDSLAYYPNGNIILRVDKRGLPLFNGLYFNELFAKRARSQLPIIILSPGLERRDEVIAEILAKSSPRIIQKKD